jgi:hypothetical protein
LLPDKPDHVRCRQWIAASTVLVRANESFSVGTSVGSFNFGDQQETYTNAYVACILSCRRTRHGEPRLVILGDLDEDHKQFRSEVAKFVEAHPDELSDLPAFPRYMAGY